MRTRSTLCLTRDFLFLLCAVFLLPFAAQGQVHGPEFQITKITKNLISPPQFSYTGAEQFPTNQRELWLEVETTFVSALAFTDELTFKYFILLNGSVLTGEVTHVNILAGRDNRSVMYVPPHTQARFMNNRAMTTAAVQNIAVQIVQAGAVRNELSLARAPARWYAGLPQVSGFVLNKNETPFAPLYWDRYEQIKSR